MSERKERTVLSGLNEIVPSQAKSYYILWRYAKWLLPKEIDTFEDLTSTYMVFTEGMTEKACEKWLAEELVQKGIVYVKRRLHQQKLIELYDMYFEKAKSDVQAFKAFIEFSEKFFNDEGEDELNAILNRTQIDDE